MPARLSRASIVSKRAKRIVADLEAQGLLEKIEDIVHAVPHDEKTKTVVLEPYLTEQWYLNVTPLAEKAIEAVEEGRTGFVPEQWAERLFQLDAQHSALVHLAPALVGPSDSRRGTDRTGTSFVEETEARGAEQRPRSTMARRPR